MAERDSSIFLSLLLTYARPPGRPKAGRLIGIAASARATRTVAYASRALP
jgi:hypothetical protein